MVEVTVLVFNAYSLDDIELLESLGVVLSNSQLTTSGVTDASGSFKTSLPPGNYFLHIVDYALSPNTGEGIFYLLDKRVDIRDVEEVSIIVEVDSRKVENELDIPQALSIDVRVIEK